MAASKAMARGLSVGLLTAAVIVGVPQVSSAGRSSRPGGIAHKLRYGPGVPNHPVGVTPSSAVSIPADWPLDIDGSIMCLTCHYALPPMNGAEDPALRDYTGSMAEPTQFCAKCHASQDRYGATNMHWMAMGVSHVSAGTMSRRSSTSGLDPESRGCLTCHDGVSAPESTNGTSAHGGFGSVADGNRNHPIGIQYPSHAGRSYSSRYRPAGMLPEAVRLPGGRVSCVSCHDLYARNDQLLTVGNHGSGLCFTCHQMD